MKDFVIVTDSTADLSFDFYKELGVEVVPMDFCIDDKTFKHYADYREMGFKEFYQNIRKGKKASTTQINYYSYELVFKKFLDEGRDVLYLCFSSGLSGTYQVAVNVANSLKDEYPQRRVEVVDTLCASVGEGLLVYYAANMKNNGSDLDQVLEWVEENKLNVAHWFVVDDLEHLKQGGRISSLQASLGAVLNLKPIISLNNEGKLVPVTRQRGSKKAIAELIKRLKQDGENIQDQTVMIGNTDNLELAQELADQIKESNLVKDVVIADIGPIIGTHVGSGMVGIVFMGKRNLS